MKRTTYFLWIIVTELVGILSGIFSRKGVLLYAETIQKPQLSPPAILFPVVWTILYALMGIGAARVSSKSDGMIRSCALNTYVVQLVVNFFWSLIFFNLQAFGFSFLWILMLLLLIIVMIFSFFRADRIAALLQIPYVLWVSFACYLNYAVWQLNR